MQSGTIGGLCYRRAESSNWSDSVDRTLLDTAAGFVMRSRRQVEVHQFVDDCQLHVVQHLAKWEAWSAQITSPRVPSTKRQFTQMPANRNLTAPIETYGRLTCRYRTGCGAIAGAVPCGGRCAENGRPT